MTPATTGRLAPVSLDTLPPYAPTTYVDFAQPEHRAAFEAALAEVQAQLGTRRIRSSSAASGSTATRRRSTSTNPARPSEVHRALPASASRAQAERAVEVAHEAFRTLVARARGRARRVPVRGRAAHARAAARVLGVDGARGRQDAGPRPTPTPPRRSTSSSSTPARCCATTQPQPLHADARRDATRWSTSRSASARSSRRGTSRCAICVGMTTAAIVTGNTVVLKPRQRLAGDRLAVRRRCMEEVGLPRGRAELPAPAAAATSATRSCEHPKTRFISFTGSKEVGHRHQRAGGRGRSPGQIWIKRVVAEMGGKDAHHRRRRGRPRRGGRGRRASAFGFQGQKCSACSRAIVARQVYDAFVAKLQAAASRR